MKPFIASLRKPKADSELACVSWKLVYLSYQRKVGRRPGQRGDPNLPDLPMNALLPDELHSDGHPDQLV